MDKKLRILQITGTMNMGGIENFLINLYRCIDRSKIQFDFIINDTGKENIFEKEIEILGGKIFKIPSIVNKGHFAYIKTLRKIFRENNYQIVHSHYNTISGFILNEAKKCGIKNRIAHSHTAPGKDIRYTRLSGFYKMYSKSLINKNSTLRFACSKEAGQWLYGNNDFKIIKNGIIAKKYIYDIKIRENKRKELNLLKNDIVISHIGSFSDVKNHNFIIRIFNELVKLNSNYKLILVGDGELRTEIEKQVKNLNLIERVLFLGIRQDVNELLQAFDLFLFPSLYEGLPVTMIEAQASGLKSFISDTISKEVDLNCKLIEWLSLNKSAKEWAVYIDNNKKYERKNTFEKIKVAGYDSEENAKKIEKLYLELLSKES